MENTPLLELKNVSKIYTTNRGLFGRGQIRAVDNVSFSLPGGQSTLLTMVGESGSGKTTITRNILGLTSPSDGEILYKGKDIFKMNSKEWTTYREQVQVVFQDPYGTYNPFYKIERVLQVPIRKFHMAKGKDAENQLIEESLKAVELRPKDIIGRYPHQLSGGERQRVMLARIHLLKPQLILADEPVSMIDVSLRAAFLNILLKFQQDYGMSCIFITHDLAVGFYLGGQILILCQGRIVEMGNMDSVVHEPKHPYSQLLISSVPPPNPKNRWSEEDKPAKYGELRHTEESAKGCIYQSRCPFAMAICKEAPPPMKSVGDGQQVACYLY